MGSCYGFGSPVWSSVLLQPLRPAGGAQSAVPVWLVSVHLCHVVSGHSGLVRKAWVFCMMPELLSRNVAGNPDSLQAVIFSTWFIDGLLAF